MGGRWRVHKQSVDKSGQSYYKGLVLVEGEIVRRKGSLDKPEGRKGKIRKTWKYSYIKDHGHRVTYLRSRTLKIFKLNNVLWNYIIISNLFCE